MGLKYETTHVCTQSGVRTGKLITANQSIETPVFMPVGTQATVKTLSPEEIMRVSEGLILANTYHLWLQPGKEVIERHGGVKPFMKWPQALLTDSGGYQVFSLANMRKITEEGVHFRHHKSGEALFLSPEKSIEIQHVLGADIMMSFDECAPFNANQSYMEASVERTLRWAKRGKDVHKTSQALFGIVQGGPFKDLRLHSLVETVAIGFAGIAIGGLSVGESKEEMYQVLDDLNPHLPKELPRYLMGVGTPEDLLESVERGMDMFDCVNPTRIARHGGAYTKNGRIVIKAKHFENDMRALDSNCQCQVCQAGFTRSYIRHLFKAGEALGARLVSYHNLHFMKQLMSDIRAAIKRNQFLTFKQQFYQDYFS